MGPNYNASYDKTNFHWKGHFPKHDFDCEDDLSDSFSVGSEEESIATFGTRTRRGFYNNVDSSLARNLKKFGKKSNILRLFSRFETKRNMKDCLSLNENESVVTWQPIAPGIRRKVVSINDPQKSHCSRRTKRWQSLDLSQSDDVDIESFIFCCGNE
mmetsp:Transcript_4416/g.8575  ORF Transcript_4416/g.8575 Transcript_4416/m.8575 type:complete len:157 (-) Transcript_4416:103-573(-)